MAVGVSVKDLAVTTAGRCRWFGSSREPDSLFTSTDTDVYSESGCVFVLVDQA